MAEHITLQVVINGLTSSLDFSAHKKLHVVIKEALDQTGNTARPPEEWQATNAAGDPLDPRKSLEDLGLTNGSQLFLSLGAGVGGAQVDSHC
jgi:hypothetical protein